MKEMARLYETAASAVCVGAIPTILLGCLLLLGPLAPGAQAEPTWLSSHDISVTESVEPTNPKVAVDSQGDAVAVWRRYNGTKDVVEAASRPAGGAWQAPVELSAPGLGAEVPQVALDSQGDAVAVWWRYNGAKDVIEAASLPAGGTWQAPVELSAAGQDALEPQVTLNAKGDAVVVWISAEGGHWIAEAATRPAGGAWQTPVELSPAGQSASVPQVAIDSQGDAVAVWKCYFCGANFIIEAASRPAGGAWQAPVELSAAGQEASSPQVALDSQGDAVAVWKSENSSKKEIIEAASRPAGGAWQAPVELSAADHNASSPQIALDPRGNATAVWERFNGTKEVIEAASRPAGGAWQAPVDISAAGQDGFEPQVALDPQGDAVAVWWRYSEGGADQTIEAASLPAGGTWQAPVELSAAEKGARSPQVALDSRGNGVAVWERENGGSWIVDAAGYDASGPLLQSLSIPSAGVAGQPLEFSVSPLDVWSGLGATNWSFGDGSSASGTSPTHTYAGAGSYPVTLTSADALGNTTSVSGTVTISARPPRHEGSPHLQEEGAHGTASAARLAQVEKGKALLRLACEGAGPCQGIAELVSREAHDSKLLGKAVFSIPAGQRRVVSIKLRKEGKALVRSAGRRGLHVKLEGSGVAARTVVLKQAVAH